MDMEDRDKELKESEIYGYFQLPKKIERLISQKKVVQLEFYDRTFSTHIEYSTLGSRTCAHKVDIAVINHIHLLEKIEGRIERKNYEWSSLQQFFQSLSTLEYQYLQQKYSNEYCNNHLFGPTDEKVFEEIQEIKEAVMYRYGIWYEKNSAVWNFEDVQEILEMMDKDVVI